MENLHRLSAEDYVPSDADCTQSRVRTSGITETFWEVKPCNYGVFDVEGGTFRSYHAFNDVDHLVFVVPLSGYDQCLIEDENAVCVLVIMLRQSQRFKTEITVINRFECKRLCFSSDLYLVLLTWFKENRNVLLFTKRKFVHGEDQTKAA